MSASAAEKTTGLRNDGGGPEDVMLVTTRVAMAHIYPLWQSFGEYGRYEFIEAAMARGLDVGGSHR